MVECRNVKGDEVVEDSVQTLNCQTILSGSNDDGFRVFFCTEEHNDQLVPVVLISSRGRSNLLHNYGLFLDRLNGILAKYAISKNECTFYLDLTEYIGLSKPNLFRWSLGKSIASALEPIDVSQLNGDDFKVIRLYYEDRWSLFTESLLTNDEKMDLIALALANSVFDEYGADDIHSILKYKLLRAVREGETFKWQARSSGDIIK